MSSPKDFHMDAVYPEPLSRLRRGMPNSDLPSSASYRRAVKKQMHRGTSGRFRTQPVTFHEIKEVDEENLTEVEVELNTSGSVGAAAASKSESDLKAKFELFYRSISSNNENQMPQRRNPINKSDAEGDSHQLNLHPLSPTSLTEAHLDRDMTLENVNVSTTTPSAPVAIPFNPKSRPSL